MKKLPFLESICWQIDNIYDLNEEQMLSRYERGWKYGQTFNNLTEEELNYIQFLSINYNSWLQNEFMNFKLDHHQNIITILQSLNTEVLLNGCAYFGGGTLLTLEFEEYRLSKDIDFICSISTSGYKYLRSLIFDHGYKVLFHNQNNITIGRSNNDQYGIRMMIEVNGIIIKMEIIAESRFILDSPRYLPWFPVGCLSLNDCFTSKLLANSDRYMDDSLQSRDLIDLAILRLQSNIAETAINKAENAYEVIRPLKLALQRFQQRLDYREKCFSILNIDDVNIAKIIDGIDLLAQDFDLELTQRNFKEQHDF